jgi:hypothetical protein
VKAGLDTILLELHRMAARDIHRRSVLAPQFPTLNQPKTMTKKSLKKSLATYRTSTSRSLSMFPCNYNLNPVIDVRRRW